MSTCFLNLLNNFKYFEPIKFKMKKTAIVKYKFLHQ